MLMVGGEAHLYPTAHIIIILLNPPKKGRLKEVKWLEVIPSVT